MRPDLVCILNSTCFFLFFIVKAVSLNTSLKELSFSGYCDFENGLCGLTSDNSTEFRWRAGSGKTPSENSGPAFDHTTFTEKGICPAICHITS